MSFLLYLALQLEILLKRKFSAERKKLFPSKMLVSDAIVHRYFVNKVSLKISQNSKEINSASANWRGKLD